MLTTLILLAACAPATVDFDTGHPVRGNLDSVSDTGLDDTAGDTAVLDEDGDGIPDIEDDDVNGDGIDNEDDTDSNGIRDNFLVSIVWTPESEIVLTLTVTGNPDTSGIILLGDGGVESAIIPVDSRNGWNTATRNQLVDLDGNNLTDTYQTLTYAYDNGPDTLGSTGTVCAVWGPRADILTAYLNELENTHAGGCSATNISTGHDSLVDTDGNWTWDGV